MHNTLTAWSPRCRLCGNFFWILISAHLAKNLVAVEMMVEIMCTMETLLGCLELLDTQD